MSCCPSEDSHVVIAGDTVDSRVVRIVPYSDIALRPMKMQVDWEVLKGSNVP